MFEVHNKSERLIANKQKFISLGQISKKFIY